MNEQRLKQLTRPGVVGLVIGFCVLSYYFIDQPVAAYFSAFDLMHRVPGMRVIMAMGEGPIYVVLFFLLALFFRYVHREVHWERRCWFLWGVVTLTTFLCLILKVTLGRARPILWLNDQIYGFYGWHTTAHYWSFPSGHTATLTSVLLGLACLFPRYLSICLFMTVLFMVARVICIHHYVSDVVGTFYLSLVGLSGFIYVLQRRGIQYA